MSTLRIDHKHELTVHVPASIWPTVRRVLQAHHVERYKDYGASFHTDKQKLEGAENEEWYVECGAEHEAQWSLARATITLALDECPKKFPCVIDFVCAEEEP